MIKFTKYPALIYIAGNILNKGSSILTLPLFTKFLAPAEYGIVAFCLLLPTLVLPALTLGQSISFPKLYFKESSSQWKQRVCDMMCLNILAIILFIGFFGLILYPYISKSFIDDQTTENYLLIIFIFTLLGAVPLPYLMRLQLDQKPIRYLIFNLALTLVNVISTLVFLIKFDMGGISLIYGYCSSQVLLILFFIPQVIQMLNRLIRQRIYDRLCSFSLIKTGAILWPSTVIIYFLYNTIRIHLTSVKADDELGIYSAAFAVSTIVTLFTNGVITAWLPWSLSSSLNWYSYVRIANRKIFYYLSLSALYLIITYVSFSFWYPILIGPDYHVQVSTLLLLICGHIFLAMHQIFQIPLYKEDKVYLINYIQGFTLIMLLFAIAVFQPNTHHMAAIMFFYTGLACFILQVLTNSLIGKNYIWIPTFRKENMGKIIK